VVSTDAVPDDEGKKAGMPIKLRFWAEAFLTAAYHGTVWMVGVNIYLKENDSPLPFAPTNICPLGCLDRVVNVDVDERGRAGPTTNLLQFATF
jgi:hypothetical protein